MEKIKEKQDQVDVVIVGTGVAGLFAALNLPRDFKIMMITKADLESSDSFLAQAESAFCAMKVIMTVILKIRCVRGIMRTEKNRSIL